MSTVRVMIVEDSPTVRQLLSHIVESDNRLALVAAVGTAEEALEKLEAARPDVVTMDIRLPGMNGFEATSLIMSQRPTPVVVISASVNADDLNISMNALRAGALTVVEKPTGSAQGDYFEVAKKLCDLLVNMSQVKVVRQRIQRPVSYPRSKPSLTLPPPPSRGPTRVVGIAASTGGPAALVSILNGLPAEFPVPILLVQHMSPSFLDGFVTWLGRSVPQGVQRARSGLTPEPGTVYVAPENCHLEVDRGSIRLVHSPPLHNQRPSATALFRSLARTYGAEAVGVLLTGMGDDGAPGLLEMVKAGAHTIAQDESSSVVFGMPAAAVALGAATEVLSLSRIPSRLLNLVVREVIG